MIDTHVYVVGLDGVPPPLLEQGIAQGRLPTLGRLRDAGASGVTHSTIPPISMLAWSTFATGRDPGNHGVFNFMLKEPASHQYRFADASVLRDNTIPVWEYLDAEGRASGTVNVMPGYPPSRTRGYHVADHITTPKNAHFVSPDWLQMELDDLVSGYEPALPSDLTTDAGKDAVQEYLDRFLRTERDNVTVANYLVERFDCALTTIVFSGPDVLLHNVGHLRDETHSAFRPALADQFGDAPLDLLKLYDRFLDRMTEQMGDDDLLFVLSDHGHGSIERTINLNAWLYQNGYLALDRDLWTRLKVFGYNYLFDYVESGLRKTGLYHWLKRTVARSSSGDDGTDLARLVTLSQDDIDWSETAAFTVSADGQLYLNSASQYEAGTVEPRRHESVKADLRRDLLDVRDPETGDQVFEDILDGSVVYDGQYESVGPDLVAVPKPGHEITFPQTMQTNRTFQPPEKPSSHTSFRERDGIFIAWGSDVVLRDAVEMGLTDFAPTVLALLGVPVPVAMDGDVRDDLVQRQLPSTRGTTAGKVRSRRCIRAVVDDIRQSTGRDQDESPHSGRRNGNPRSDIHADTTDRGSEEI